MVMPPRGDPPHYHATEAVPMRGRSIIIYSMCTYKYCMSNTQRVITVMYNSSKVYTLEAEVEMVYCGHVAAESRGCGIATCPQ